MNSARRVGAVLRTMISRGETTLPLRLDIFSPSGPLTMPWVIEPLHRLVDRRRAPAPASPWSRSGSRAGASTRARARPRRRRPAASESALARANGRLVVVRVEVARAVPGGVDEGVHRLRLAARRAAALRAAWCSPTTAPSPAAARPCRSALPSRRCPAAAPAAGRPAPGCPCLRDRTCHSRRWGSACPSSAGARCPSRAGDSSPPACRCPAAAPRRRSPGAPRPEGMPVNSPESKSTPSSV